MKFVTSKKDCLKSISGVCEGCGRKLQPIRTVDNAGNPTYWISCKHCSCFRSGVNKKYWKIARQLVESGELIPYGSMFRGEYADTPERLDYWLDSQTAGLSHTILRIHKMLIKEGIKCLT